MKVLDQHIGRDFSAYNADCVTFAQGMPDGCIDFSVYSPPFSSLYVYSESIADMGNVDSDEEFIEQYRFLVREKLRITRPGRLSAIHVKDLVYCQTDMCRQVHEDEGWTFHCRITIFRDPVLERAKTNAHGLLWKTFQKDASFCRVGMPEYLMVFRKWAKPGEDVSPVTHPRESVPLEVWQDLASPVWNWRDGQSGKGDWDMPATDVLNVDTARDEKAEKHLCPMPLNIMRRALRLWSNEGDVVFSPFMGIGSEGVASIGMRRRFIGTELHPTYYRQAVKFLDAMTRNGESMELSFA